MTPFTDLRSDVPISAQGLPAVRRAGLPAVIMEGLPAVCRTGLTPISFTTYKSFKSNFEKTLLSRRSQVVS